MKLLVSTFETKYFFTIYEGSENQLTIKELSFFDFG